MNIPYIPYFQTSRYRVQAMIDLAEINRDLPPGRQEKAADLGTGDGRIAIALAKSGAIVTAYELDDERIKEAKENIKKEFSQMSSKNYPELSERLSEGLSVKKDSSTPLRVAQNDNNITPPIILKKDFWFENLSQYSIICCYPMPTIMGRLENKLKTELKPGSRVLLNYFPFLHWKEKARKDNIFLYIKL